MTKYSTELKIKVVKASLDAVRRTAADQWIEMIQPVDLSEGVLATIFPAGIF